MEDEKKKWERYSATISPDLKDRLDSTRDQAGLKHEDFLNQMLAAFESQLDAPGSSMESKEMNQVRQNLRNIEAVVLSVITLAKDKADQSVQKLDELRKDHTEEIASLKLKIQMLSDDNKSLLSENEMFRKDQESREALKQAWEAQKAGWQDKEQVYKDQIAGITLKFKKLPEELEQKKTALAKAIQEITGLKNETSALKHQNELDKQKAENILQKALSEKTESLRREFDEKLDTARDKNQIRANEILNQEKATAKERIDELSTQFESRIKELSDQLKQYKGIIDNMTQAETQRAKEYEKRIDELSKKQSSRTKKTK